MNGQETDGEGLPSQKKMLGLASRIAAFDHTLSPKELADLLGLNKVTILRWVREGRITGAFKLGTKIHFDQRQTAEWAKTVRGDKRQR